MAWIPGNQDAVNDNSLGRANARQGRLGLRPMQQPAQQQGGFQMNELSRFLNALGVGRNAPQQQQQQPAGGVSFGAGGSWGYNPQQQSPYVQGVVGAANARSGSQDLASILGASTAQNVANTRAGSQDLQTTTGSRTALQLSQMQNEAKWAQMNRLAQILNTGGVQTDYGAGYS